LDLLPVSTTWAEFDANGTTGWLKGDGELLALVLHGGPGLTDYTEALADEVFAGGDGRLRVARYQQRGLKPSTLAGPFTVRQLVTDLVAVVGHLGAEAAVLVGHSWGGHLAMHAAVAAPDRVAALMLVDSLGGVGDGGTGTMGPIIDARIGEAGLAAVAALDASGLDPDRLGLETLRLRWPGYFADAAAAPPMPPIDFDTNVGGQIEADAFAMLTDGVLERGLRSVRIPALHLIARHSPIEPAANERTAALMPNARVQSLDTGHFVWLEQPGAVESATRELLSLV
jgi:pimeloyl-ACP methyl ester carboxylesterase